MASLQSRFRYQEIARELRSEIARGVFRRSGKLPSERLLGDRFGVQRNTIRQALTLLEQEGQIRTEGRRGSFVCGPQVSAQSTILLSLPLGPSPQLTQLAEGVTRAVRTAGLRVGRLESHHPEGGALDPVPNPQELSPETTGLILWPQNPTNEEALSRLNAAVPLVLVDRRVPGVVADVVRFDDVTGGQIVTEHLLKEGHRRIGFLTDDAFAETVQHRWQGYVAALEAAEVPIDPTLSLFLNGLYEPFFGVAMRHLLGRADAPTAMVCSNDVVAFQLLNFLQSEGLRVPDDLAVTGYGNTMPDYLHAMGLTSVEQPFAELGRSAANLLLDKIGLAAQERPRDVTIPVALVVRKSSGLGRRAGTGNG